MRHSEPAAFRAYFERFRPLLLREAQRIGVQPALVTEMAGECLGNVVLRLVRYTSPVPRLLAPYLVRALRLHCLHARRTERRRANAEANHEDDTDGPLHTSLSEFARREGAGPDTPPSGMSPTLRRLAMDLDAMLSDAERLLLLWVGEGIPQSTIAQWLGVSHGAARNRIMRLRERLHDDASFFVLVLAEDDEREEITAFFNRTHAAPARRSTRALTHRRHGGVEPGAAR